MPKPSFVNLWDNYPKDDFPCDGGWDNQCAIRMSLTLNGEGTVPVNSGTYTEPKCSHGHARGAESLANWLWKNHLGRPKIYKNPAEGKKTIASKKGILFFKDCFIRDGETERSGDHIDLWNAGQTKTYNDPSNNSAQLWFWELA